MRVKITGVERAEAPFELRLGERSIVAYPGETVAAALIANGLWRCRESRDGEPRGVYCGMGVCGECTMTFDGEPRRACLEPARPGLRIGVQPARSGVPATPSSACGPAIDAPAGGVSAGGVSAAPTSPGSAEWIDVGVLVIGAGPAGLAAARAAAQQGADVLVLDERSTFGGQYYKQPAAGFRVDAAAIDAQFAAGRARHDAAVAAGARFLFGATVWGSFGPGEIAVSAGARRLRIRAGRIVAAPGAYERGLPVPGWTLPGVITTGAAQTLLRAYSVAPGRRVLVAGHGPLNLQVARELVRAGVEVVAVAELAAAPGPSALPDLLRLAAAAPSLVREGFGHVAALVASGVPRLHGHVLVRAEASPDGERVGSATVARVDAAGRPLAGTERTFGVDAVCMGYGFAPQSELPRALGCRFVLDAGRGTLAVERADDGRTNVPEVFVVGDAGGLGGAKLAEAQGALAGAAAAADLGHALRREHRALLDAARALQTRHRRFQEALWRIYRAPLLTYELAAPDTRVCRCEDVNRADLEACFVEGVQELGAVKRATRAGMGRCQGRYCAVSIAAMAKAAGAPVADDAGWFAPRTPFKPIRIDQLAGPADAPLEYGRAP